MRYPEIHENARKGTLMVSIYALKGRFQKLLRPAVRRLHAVGCTANQVTVAAAVISISEAAVV